jgi:hypothetical protein
MHKQLLTEDEFIAELNSQLRKDADYQEGMAFVSYPEGTKGGAMSGYSTTGPMGLTGIYARVAHEVFSRAALRGSTI